MCNGIATIPAYETLKGIVRYLIGHRRVWVFEKQEPVRHLTANMDSDHAGCKVIRKSTTCVVIRLRRHVIRSYSSMQSIIALSSGDSEFYGIEPRGP